MKKILFFVLTFILIKPILSSTYVPEERDLLNLANEKLQVLANENGFVLEEDATSFSSSVGTKAIQLTSGFGVGAVSSAVVNAPIHAAAGAATGPGGAALSAGLFALAGGLAIGYVSVNPVPSDVEADPYAKHRTFFSHYRMKLNYQVNNNDSFLRGSCIFFFSVDVNQELAEATVSIEIDPCTHANIFPENERGSLRIREDGEEGWWDEKLGQIDVVATGSYKVPIEGPCDCA